MSNERPTTIRSLLALPSGWLPVVAVGGASAALSGLLVTWVALLAAGVSPGASDAARHVVGGPVPESKGVIWFYFDAHWVASQSAFTNTVVSAHPLSLAEADLRLLHAVPGIVAVAGAMVVRSLRIDDSLTGAVAGGGTAVGYLPTMLLLWWVSRVPLTRHASDGRVPIWDSEGVPVSVVRGVSAGPDLVSAVLFVTVLSATLGAVGGAIGTVSVTTDCSSR